MPMLYSILKKVYGAGGIVEVLSIGGWKALITDLSSTNKEFSEYEPNDLLSIYVRHLI